MTTAAPRRALDPARRSPWHADLARGAFKRGAAAEEGDAWREEDAAAEGAAARVVKVQTADIVLVVVEQLGRGGRPARWDVWDLGQKPLERGWREQTRLLFFAQCSPSHVARERRGAPSSEHPPPTPVTQIVTGTLPGNNINE